MSGEEQTSSRDADENLKAVYQEVCHSFHAIADFRAKLQGFLPLAPGAGIFLLLNRSSTDGTWQYLLPIGGFGFIITLGLFFYELRGIQKCNSLVRGGQNIEGLLGIHGQFRLLPPPIELIRKPYPKWLKFLDKFKIGIGSPSSSVLSPSVG